METITPRAHLMLLWRCADWQDVRSRRLIHLVSQILERRLRQEIREARGLTYSTSLCASQQDLSPLMSALYVEFTTDPGKLTKQCRWRGIVEKFAAEGPTAEEVHTVHKQFKNSVETMLKEPGSGWNSWLISSITARVWRTLSTCSMRCWPLPRLTSLPKPGKP